MRLSSGSTFDQIDLPASNTAILDAYTAAKQHMDRVIDTFLNEELGKSYVSGVSATKLYECFSLQCDQSGIPHRDPQTQEKLKVILDVTKQKLLVRGYQLLKESYGEFKIMPLQEYIASDLEFVVRNTEGKDQVRNAAYVTRTAIEKAGRIMEGKPA